MKDNYTQKELNDLTFSEQILKVLIRIEERLSVIEQSVKREETTKQILND